ncbi:MAG: PorV/PorQ family protein [Chitinivibrionales bacterium]|nr:PorV/PorQ family protein [Chitinivibrionales bacterium]
MLSPTMRLSPLPLTIVLLISMQSTAGAQHSAWLTDLAGENSGHTTAHFLTLPVNATQLASGQAAYSYVSNASDIFQLPAASAFFTHYSVTASHLTWLMDLRHEYIAGAFPVINAGTFGGYANLLTAGDFGPSRDIDEHETSPRYGEFSIGATYARQLLYERLAVGTSAALVQSRLDDIVGRTFAASLSGMYRHAKFHVWTFMRNMGPDMTYTATPEPLPLQVGLGFKVLPFQTEAQKPRPIDLNLTAGALKTADEPLLMGASVHTTLLSIISARLGYEYTYGKDPGIAGLGWGIGVHIKHYRASFGWKYQNSELGSVWGISAGADFYKVSARSAEDLYLLAERAYRNKRYRRAIAYAKKAVNLNPNLWRAHALIARARTELRKSKGMVLAVVYAGNLKGALMETVSGNRAGGGLARQATAIKALRKQFPLTLVLNVGNNLTRTSAPHKAQLIDMYNKHMNFDAVALGKGEVDYTAAHLESNQKHLSTRLLCTNAGVTPGLKTEATKTLTIGSYKVFIAAFSSACAAQGDRDLVGDQLYRLRNAFNSPQARESDLRILIVDDTWQKAQATIRQLTKADIVICSAIPQQLAAPMSIGQSAVVAPGDSGYFAGRLVVGFDENKKIAALKNKLIALNPQVLPDPEIEASAQTASMQAAFAHNDIDQQELKRGSIDGVVVFVSDRKGVPHIYLKVIAQTAEFPLTFGAGACTRPRLSWSAGKIANLHRDANDKDMSLRLMDINGKHAETVFHAQTISSPAFSADGAYIYFAASHRKDYTHLYRLALSSLKAEPLVEWKHAAIKDIALSTDMAMMAFAAQHEKKWHVYLASATGEKPLRISPMHANATQPHYSPEGKLLAYLTDEADMRDSKDLALYAPATGKSVRITTKANVQEFIWTPDNQSIIYSSGVNLFDLNVYHLQSNTTTKLITSATIKDYSERQPRLLQYKGRTKIAYYREYPDGERAIYWVNADGSKDQLIVNSHSSDWFE